MIITLFGGASSGKSELAEDLAIKFGGKQVYIATAISCGAEMDAKIAIHRSKRIGKGFFTIEQAKGLQISIIDGFDTVLLECVSNWAANEIFAGGNIDNIYKFIIEARKSPIHFVFVTSDIFGDGLFYSQETVAYMKILGEINTELARVSDIFLEVICGQVICLKGEEEYEKYR